ncbi:hypothetical protein CapIbe_017429 [Capra ibex]
MAFDTAAQRLHSLSGAAGGRLQISSPVPGIPDKIPFWPRRHRLDSIARQTGEPSLGTLSVQKWILNPIHWLQASSDRLLLCLYEAALAQPIINPSVSTAGRAGGLQQMAPPPDAPSPSVPLAFANPAWFLLPLASSSSSSLSPRLVQLVQLVHTIHIPDTSCPLVPW